MRTSRILWLLGIVVALVALLAAACGDGDDGAEPTATQEQQQEEPTATEEPPVAEDVPGVTDTEVILGTHTSLTGPIQVYSQIPNVTKAYFDYINATEGGVHGRQITYLLEDDQYSPALAVDVVRKLVEQDEVFAIINGLGTPTHLQVVDYLLERGIPDLFVATGAIEWVKDPGARPNTFGSIANYVAEGLVLGNYIAETYPGQKLGLLFQNDAFGFDGIDGIKRGVGDALAIVAEESYEVTDTDLNAQIDRLNGAGADVIAAWASPTYLSSAMKHARLDLGWDAPFVFSGVSANEFTPLLAGAEVAEGAVSVVQFLQAYETDNPAVAKHLEIIAEYAGFENANYLTLYGQYIGEITVEALRLAGPDLTRESFIAAAESITDFQCSVCLFVSNTSPTDHDPGQAVLLARIEGGLYVPFGPLYDWEGVLPGDMTVDDLQTVASPY